MIVYLADVRVVQRVNSEAVVGQALDRLRGL